MAEKSEVGVGGAIVDDVSATGAPGVSVSRPESRVVVRKVGGVELISFQDGPGLTAEGACMLAEGFELTVVGGVEIIKITGAVAKANQVALALVEGSQADDATAYIEEDPNHGG